MNRAALQRLAARIAPGTLGEIVRLSGGATQELWRFDIDGARYVLRRSGSGDQPPAIGVSLTEEAGLIVAAGKRGVPVPRVVHILEAADALGAGFVMAYVEGEALGARIVKDPTLAHARTMLAAQCGAALARIHSVDTDPLPGLIDQSPADIVAQWHMAYRAGTIRRPVFEAAFRWLDTHHPGETSAARLVHGDFRNGNIMVGPEGLTAVLDWELAHIGDPMEDLGWICVNSWRFGRIGLPVGGFGTREQLYAGYEAAGGCVDRAAAQWWEMLGTLRWGVMTTGSLARVRDGDMSIERAMIARRTSETEIDLLAMLAA